jgi:hypothetical protein
MVATEGVDGHEVPMGDELKDPLGEYRRVKQLSAPHYPFLGLRVFGYFAAVSAGLAAVAASIYYLLFD